MKYWQIFERCRRIYVCMYINNEMKITTLIRLIYIYIHTYTHIYRYIYIYKASFDDFTFMMHGLF